MTAVVVVVAEMRGGGAVALVVSEEWWLVWGGGAVAAVMVVVTEMRGAVVLVSSEEWWAAQPERRPPRPPRPAQCRSSWYRPRLCVGRRQNCHFDCHFDGTPVCIPLLKHVMKVEGGCSRVTVSPTATQRICARSSPHITVQVQVQTI